MYLQVLIAKNHKVKKNHYIENQMYETTFTMLIHLQEFILHLHIVFYAWEMKWNLLLCTKVQYFMYNNTS